MSVANMLLIGGAGATLLFPLASAAWLRFVAKSCAANQQPTRWVRYARWASLQTIFAVPIWWSLSVLLHDSVDNSRLASMPLWILLVIPLSTTMLIGRFVTYQSDAYVFGKKWTGGDVFRLAFWRTASSTFALLFVAVGMEQIYAREIAGFLWMFGAALIAVFGKVELRAAEGLTPRRVKSGELYKRSLVMSKKMGVHIERVCVVPFGRGHLTNAYGGIRQIAVTDDYGLWLHGAQLDFVIGHELAHVRRKDAVQMLAIMSGLFVAVAIALMVMPRLPMPWKILSNFIAILLPLAIFYALSRRHEYIADRLSVEATDEPEAAIRALTGLYRRAEIPVRFSRLVELFSTHPDLGSRIDAIARQGRISADAVVDA